MKCIKITHRLAKRSFYLAWALPQRYFQNPHTSDMSDVDPLSSISLKQLAALYVSDAILEENFKQLAAKFFPSSARPSISGKNSLAPSQRVEPPSDYGNLMHSTPGNGKGHAAGSPLVKQKGNFASFSAGTASPQLRQVPINDRDRYLFSMDLQNMFVLLRVPNLRESDAIRALACLDPKSVSRCVDQLRRCRSTGAELTTQTRPVTPLSTPLTSLSSASSGVKYSSPVWRPTASRPGLGLPVKPRDSLPHAVHAVNQRGIEDTVLFPPRPANQTKRASNSGQRPSSAPTSSGARLWRSSANGAPPSASSLVTQRSYALTHRDQVARDVVGAVSWLGEVCIDTTSPASLAQRKARKDFRVAHAVRVAETSRPSLSPSKEERYGGYVQKSAKKSGLLSQQSNTTSVVVKALQLERAKGSHACGVFHDDQQHASSSSAKRSGGSSASKWVQSDARFNMHQRRRLLLQQLL